MKKCFVVQVVGFLAAVALVPNAVLAQEESALVRDVDRWSAHAGQDQQSNVPAGVRQAEQEVEEAVRRFRIGVQGGVAVDPELIVFGAHGEFGPIFRPGVNVRPGIDFGVGEVTTTLGINLDVLYTLPGRMRADWTPYVGIGPNFGLSHQSFEPDEDDLEDDDRNRFDFSDTDFEGGVNFIAGARRRNGMFLELRATAYGVANVKLLVGFDFWR